MNVARAYLDTCIVSSLAKCDLTPENESALLRILQARKAGTVELVTSEVVRTEISAIPEEFRIQHSIIYSLLADVPLAATDYRIPPFRPAPMFKRRDQLLVSLERLLPDAGDASHVFQAARNGVGYLITVDHRTMLKHAEAVSQLCGVRLVNPVQFEHAVLAG
jgi:hypothetical protein